MESSYTQYPYTETGELSGIFKKIKKAVKRAVTPPREIRKASISSITKLSPSRIITKLKKGVTRLSKAKWTDWITKTPFGIADPKFAAVWRKSLSPVIKAVLEVVPGGQAIVFAWEAAEMAANYVESERLRKQIEKLLRQQGVPEADIEKAFPTRRGNEFIQVYPKKTKLNVPLIMAGFVFGIVALKILKDAK
jgi:hypothetical protein